MTEITKIGRIGQYVIDDLAHLGIDATTEDKFLDLMPGVMEPQYVETLVGFHTEEDMNLYKLLGAWTEFDYVRIYLNPTW